jgi:hypothetical protein
MPISYSLAPTGLNKSSSSSNFLLFVTTNSQNVVDDVVHRCCDDLMKELRGGFFSIAREIDFKKCLIITFQIRREEIFHHREKPFFSVLT